MNPTARARTERSTCATSDQPVPRDGTPHVATSTTRSPISLTDGERGVLEALLRLARDGGSGSVSVPVADLAGAAGLALDDTRGATSVLRSLAGRVAEWTSPTCRTIAPLLAEVQVEGSVCRCVLSPALRRQLSPDEDDADGGTPKLRQRLTEFGLTGRQVERALALPAEHVERNLAYVEGELTRGREIEALGAYTYRAIQGDWGGSAEAARKKRAAVRQEASARAKKTARALFPPPALVLARAARLEAEEDRRLDEHVAGLTDAERVRLDAEAMRHLRASSHPGAAEVERAVTADAETTLGPAALGALTAARRDVMADWLRRGALAVLVGLSVFAAGCTRGESAVPRSTPEEHTLVAEGLPLLGVWDLADVGSGFGECHEASIGFRSDGRYMAKSGDQVVVGRYVAEPAVVDGRDGFLVVQRPGAHNDRPNCQGVPADVSLATSPPAAFVEVDRATDGRQPERARLYFGGQSERLAAHLVRRTLHD